MQSIKCYDKPSRFEDLTGRSKLRVITDCDKKRITRARVTKKNKQECARKFLVKCHDGYDIYLNKDYFQSVSNSSFHNNAN